MTQNNYQNVKMIPPFNFVEKYPSLDTYTHFCFLQKHIFSLFYSFHPITHLSVLNFIYYKFNLSSFLIKDDSLLFLFEMFI